MDNEEIELEAIALIDEFSANVEGKSLMLAISSEVDTLTIKAIGAYCLGRFIEKPDAKAFSEAFGQAVALGAFLQHKGRFDIMKLRGTIQ